MILRKTRLIESYTIPMLRRDMRNYDKLCNYETGLIEINKALRRALKRAEKKREMEPFSPKIDLKMIKNKVESVTKQAQADEAKEVTIDVNIVNAKESDMKVNEETITESEKIDESSF
jgi:2'-5' RNA ligase